MQADLASRLQVPRPAATGSVFDAPPLVDEAWSTSLAASGRFALCWMVSALVHMLLVLLLGAWFSVQDARPGPMVLAASIGEPARSESVEQLDKADVEIARADLPVEALSAETTADKQLVESITSVEPPSGELIARDASMLPTGHLSAGQVLAGRDPAFRGALLASGGGSSGSEAAVARALVWLANHQNADGSWSLNRFGSAGDCHGRCGDTGVESDTSATALALLPFFGSGQTHLRGNYTSTVARGLRALIDMQRPDGDLRGRGQCNMYAHGQAAIALCEAYALTQADNLRQPAQRAIDFIVSAQHVAGGWRYQPKQPGDLSVVGWQMMALRSAQMAYLNVPNETFLKTTRFLNSVQANTSVGLYSYVPGGKATMVMTAEGLLCRQYSGWRHNNSVLRNGVFWLEANHLPRADRANMYYWYYGTQVMHHMGGESWEKWNDALRDLLISLQSTSGHEAGSWKPLGGHDAQGGRLYTTALAACTLEVYYRHLPLYGGAAVGSEHEREKAKSSRPGRGG